ncbi:GNAT family N-acetyltransferase [Thalassotalea atypica]|uniref:GNAT family N-acetyltransferase n=1 Tax=Thalassotalea atypica TaxID=2054316 RepID=UPI002573F31B|nr:GNAT family N-acetyltransferase [Thalassotalea atypica]
MTTVTEPTLTFETLSLKHLDLLLQFESENKAWFESLITPRPASFYSTSGIEQHIIQAEKNMKRGSHYSGVLIHQGFIVARGNLKDIETQNHICSVGYRVAEHSINKGYASYCLKALLERARTTYSTRTIHAQVLENNPASIAVLKKLDFTPYSFEPNFITLNGKALGCTTFTCRLLPVTAHSNY